MRTGELGRILYVDDEPDIREIATIALENVGGYKVEACESGEQALLVLRTFRPDLILLDVMMPGMDGPTTLRRMREMPEAQDIPAVFMTAKVQSDEIRDLERSGALGVIAKPFDPMALSQTLQDLWSAGRARSVAPLVAAATDTASADADFLAEVSREFVRTLPPKLEEVVSLWTALADGAATPEQRQALYRNVHSLAGSAKTFGCAPVSAAARTLEYQLKPVVARSGALAPDERSRLQSLVEALLASAPSG